MSNNGQFGLDLIKLLFQNRLNLDNIKQNVQYTIKRWIPEIDNVLVKVYQINHSIYLNVTIYVGGQSDTIYLEYEINEN